VEDYDKRAYEFFNTRQRYDQEARGKIIYAAVRVESVIEQIIAEHFCDKKDQAMFISLLFIVGQITFSQKLIILKKLFKEYYPDLLTTFPKIFSRLDKLRELRNKLAHSKIGYSFPNLEDLDTAMQEDVKGTTLEYFKDGEVIHELISCEQVDTTLDEARAYSDILTFIEMEIRNRSKNKLNRNFTIALRHLRERYPNLVTSVL
jgi:hypothetical protein